MTLIILIHNLYLEERSTSAKSAQQPSTAAENARKGVAIFAADGERITTSFARNARKRRGMFSLVGMFTID